MSLLQRLKENRLKVASFAALSGDILMGLGGGVGLFHVSFDNSAYMAMSIGGCAGLTGHAALLAWGKGAREQDAVSQGGAPPPPILLKPLFPWRYPLDFALMFFILSNLFYIMAGVYMDVTTLILSGVFGAIASLIGWLWPPERLIFRLRSMQVTSLCFFVSTVNHLMAGALSGNIYILLSGCCFFVCNMIFFTVRKENQSSFTQAHES